KRSSKHAQKKAARELSQEKQAPLHVLFPSHGFLSRPTKSNGDARRRRSPSVEIPGTSSAFYECQLFPRFRPLGGSFMEKPDYSGQTRRITSLSCRCKAEPPLPKTIVA